MVSPLNYKNDLRSYLETSKKAPIYELVKKYEPTLDRFLSDRKWIKLYENKMTALLFLESISNVIGREHPLSQYVDRLGFGASTLASLEWIHWVQSIIDDPRLKETTISILKYWVKREIEYLPQAVLFDAWRATPEMVQFISKDKAPKYYEVTTPLDFSKLMVSVQQSIRLPPEEEMKRWALTQVERLKNLKSLDSFHQLGGYCIHEARIIITKHLDGTYHLDHFPVGSSNGKVYENIDPQKLENPQFWIQFLKLKLTAINMDEMYNHLNTLNPNPTKHPIQKTAQMMDSCPSQCIEAQLKFRIMDRPDPDAEQEYKVFKALIVAKAFQERGKSVDKELSLLLAFKNKKRSIYLKWAELVKDPDPTRVNNLILAYEKTLPYIGLTPEERQKPPTERFPNLFIALNNYDSLLENDMKWKFNKELINLFPPDLAPPCLQFPSLMAGISHQVLKYLLDTQKVFFISLANYLPSFANPFPKLSPEFITSLMINIATGDESSLTALLEELISCNLLDLKFLNTILYKIIDKHPEVAKALGAFLYKQQVFDDVERLKLAAFAGPEACKTEIVKFVDAPLKSIYEAIHLVLGIVAIYHPAHHKEISDLIEKVLIKK